MTPIISVVSLVCHADMRVHISTSPPIPKICSWLMHDKLTLNARNTPFSLPSRVKRKWPSFRPSQEIRREPSSFLLLSSSSSVCMKQEVVAAGFSEGRDGKVKKRKKSIAKKVPAPVVDGNSPLKHFPKGSIVHPGSKNCGIIAQSPEAK